MFKGGIRMDISQNKDSLDFNFIKDLLKGEQ